MWFEEHVRYRRCSHNVNSLDGGTTRATCSIVFSPCHLEWREMSWNSMIEFQMSVSMPARETRTLPAYSLNSKFGKLGVLFAT
jgi:hypothetical protein